MEPETDFKNDEGEEKNDNEHSASRCIVQSLRCVKVKERAKTVGTVNKYEKEKQQEEISPGNIRENEESAETINPCTLDSDKTLNSKCKIKKRRTIGHRRVNHNVCVSETKTYFDASSNLALQLEITSNNDKELYPCEVCGKVFDNSVHSKIHSKVHTGEKPYSCEVCRKRFSQMSHLKDHVMTHTGEKPFDCYICCKSFSRSSNLKAHVKTHTGEKPYVCNSCGKSFSVSNDLKKHLRTHTGEKPYICQICGKAFAVSCNLKKHTMTHTYIVGENSRVTFS